MKTRGRSWIFCVCALSCGGASKAPNTVSKNPGGTPEISSTDGSAGRAPERDARRANESAEEGSPASKTANPVLDSPAPDSVGGGASPFQLKLRKNEAFLRARLPEMNRGRYGGWQQQTNISVGQSHLHHASFTDGERKILALSDAEGSVRVYDRKSRRLVAKHDFGFERFEAGFLLAWDPLPGSAPGDPSYFALAKKMGVDLHEVESGALTARLLEGSVRSMRLSPDKSILMTASQTAQGHSLLSFFERTDERAMSALGTIEMTERVDAWDLSRDNRLLAVNYYPSDDLVVYDLENGRETLRLKGPKYTAGIAFSPNGRWLAAGGKGLLLIDLVTPTRRAFYSYFYNNINTVRFSPSGDAIATSSYDGHIRIFRYGSAGPSLDLMRSLRHTGRANVYRIQFDREGDHLLSASGDQTVRIFGGTYRPPSRSPEHDAFHSPEKWRDLLPDSEKAQPRAPPAAAVGHRSPLLDAPPRPSRIKPGQYACRITAMYKLRDCTVTKTSTGHTLLQFHEGNLLKLKGILYDDGPVVRYEAWEIGNDSVIACPGCERQLLHGVFRGSGRSYSGLLTFRVYFDPLNPAPLPESNVKFEEADDRFPLSLQFRAPLADEPRNETRDLLERMEPRLLPLP